MYEKYFFTQSPIFLIETHVEKQIFSKWQTGNTQAILIQILSVDNVFLHLPCRHAFSKNMIECSNFCVIDIFTF